ncbi:MAG: shikimate kinase [Acidobacteriota bacterium]|nr:shikimate kinase [Acidobacteriota bacterium]
MHIFLIGFMGSGKTTVGSRLADRLELPWIDLDAEIELRNEQTIPEIFARHGEETFRKLEHESLLEAVGRPQAVIATGGGLAAQERGLDVMQETGITVWINPSLATIVRRLADSAVGQRPLFQDLEQVKALYRRRLPFYRRCRVHVDVGASDSPQQVVEGVVAAIAPMIGGSDSRASQSRTAQSRTAQSEGQRPGDPSCAT